jgi:hypothetical protein
MAVAILNLIPCTQPPFDAKAPLGISQPIGRLVARRIERDRALKGRAGRLVVPNADRGPSSANQAANFLSGIKARV